MELQGRPKPSDTEGTISSHESEEYTELSQRDNSNETYFRRWEDEIFGEDYQLYWTINTFSKGIVTGDVLDIGCGSRVYYDVADVTSWVGMDLSEKLLSRLSFLGGLEPSRIERIVQSCERIPYDTESFDTVCAIFMIHHLGRHSKRRSQRIVRRVLKEVSRVIRKDGRFVMAEVHPRLSLLPYRIAFPIIFPLVRRIAKIELPFFWTHRELTAMLAEVGFGRCRYVNIPLVEAMKLPIFGIPVPPGFVSTFQIMSLAVYTKE